MKALRLCLLLGAALTPACTSLGTLTPPDVSMVNLEFTDLTVFETSGEVTVRITNENPEPLVLTGAVFKIFLNGVAVGKALDSEGIEVPRLGSATKKVALYVNNVALVARLATLLEQPVLDYRIRSKLWLVRPYGTRRVRLDHSGRFDIGGDGPAAAVRAEPEGPTDGES